MQRKHRSDTFVLIKDGHRVFRRLNYVLALKPNEDDMSRQVWIFQKAKLHR